MHATRSTTVGAALLIFLLALSQAATQVFAAVAGSMAPGWNAFAPVGTGTDYRYGPSMILNGDGTLDMWTCSPGTSGWDSIRYKRSSDGGVTWGAESIALDVTPGSDDRLSTCDPGVFRFGGYYYIGYTSTKNGNGTQNFVFVARSTAPGGPYEKWNGNGWGGNPAAFISYDGPSDTYGAGEPSFVVKGSTLYIYYTWRSRDPSSGKPINQTRVNTATLPNNNWPAAMTYRGVAITRNPEGDADGDDSTDHKWVPSMNKFIAIGSSRRFTPFSYIKLYESTDGLTYTPATLPRAYMQPFAHNAGISGDELGNFDPTKKNRIAYAYGTAWGHWFTGMQPFSLTDSPLPAVPVIQSVIEGNSSVQLVFRTTGLAGETYNLHYGTASGQTSTTVSGVSSPYTLTGLTNGTTYYFNVTGSNSSGESAPSPQVGATPLALMQATAAGAIASTYVTAWEPAKAIDGNILTSWSSLGHSSQSASEWITADTGTNSMVRRVTLTPRQPEEFGYPNSFTGPAILIQVSIDQTTWVDADVDVRAYRLESPTRHIYEFNQPLYGRYVRINANSLTHDQFFNYYFQLGEITVEAIPYGAAGSTALTGWDSDKVLDNDPTTVWSSWASKPAGVQSLTLDMGAISSVSGVRVTPRPGGWCYPTAFKFQYSRDGSTWIDIPGASYAGVPNPGSNAQTYKFTAPVQARYVRMSATALSADSGGTYYMQIADFVADTLPKRIPGASSSVSGWDVSNVADGQPDTYWSSSGYSSASATEWVQVDMGSVQNWSGMRLYPRPQYCFPVSFKLQASIDGSTWSDIPGQSYTTYPNPGSATQVFSFGSLVSARYLRVYATTLSADDTGWYRFQLGEVVVDP